MLNARILKLITLICFCSCTSTERSKETLVKKINYFDIYPEMKEIINGSTFDAEGNSWTIIQHTDSTVKIEWQTEKYKRQTIVDFPFGTARHFESKWLNKKFIALRTHTGTDDWLEVYLPLDTNRAEIIIKNPLARDREKNLIISEGSQDTIAFINNLITGERSGIIEKEFKCESAFWHYCIDSVSINNSDLYLSLQSVDKKTKTLRKYKL